MNLNVVIDGKDHVLPMDILPPKMPILSVRKLVRNGNYETFRDSGGHIKNVKTGHKMRFIESKGVYFIKVQKKAPSLGKAPESLFKAKSGFSRPGR